MVGACWKGIRVWFLVWMSMVGELNLAARCGLIGEGVVRRGFWVIGPISLHVCRATMIFHLFLCV